MNIRAILGASILLLASVPSAHASTLPVATTIDGLDWTMVSAFQPVNVFSLCGYAGLCNGVDSTGTDLTGWHWANEAEAMKLMNDILGSSLPATYTGDTSSWFDIFGHTGQETGAEWSGGIYFDWDSYGPGPIGFSSNDPFFVSFIGGVYAIRCTPGGIETDLCTPDLEFASAGLNDYFWATGTGGYLLWRPSPAPIPATTWLFGTALVGLIGFGRRKKAA